MKKLQMWVMHLLLYAILQQLVAAIPSFRRNNDRQVVAPNSPENVGSSVHIVLPAAAELLQPYTPPSPTSRAAAEPGHDEFDHDGEFGVEETKMGLTSPSSQSIMHRGIAIDRESSNIFDHRVRSIADASDFFALPHVMSPVSADQMTPHYQSGCDGNLAFYNNGRPAFMSPLHVENLRDGPQFLALNTHFRAPTRAQRAHLQVNQVIHDLVELGQELDGYFLKRRSYERRYGRWWPFRRRELLSAIDTVYNVNKLRDEKIRAMPHMTFNAMATEIMLMYTPLYHLSSHLDC